MSLWPNKGEEDLRPPLGAGYQRIDRSRPVHPPFPDRARPRCGTAPVPLGYAGLAFEPDKRPHDAVHTVSSTRVMTL